MIVVTFESSEVLGACLESMGAAAPERGVDVRVVDNASTDESAAIAEAHVGAERVVRLARNRGFAAGVNAGIAATRGPWIAVLNPDTRLPPAALDRLVDELQSDPRAGLIAPRVRDAGGRPEATVGTFPTARREMVHAWGLDRLTGRGGRRAHFPARTAPVDWVSGCAWLLRRAAVEAVGPLDEEYFMYYEDVDYCRRLRDGGWSVLATPDVEIEHGIGRGSRISGSLPVDGGGALLRYFAKFHSGQEERRARREIEKGWRLRRLARAVRARLGDGASARMVERYSQALESLGRS